MYIFRVTLIDLIYFIDIVIDLQVQMCMFAVCVCVFGCSYCCCCATNETAECVT